MVEYEIIDGRNGEWYSIMERTKEIRDKIWGSDELEEPDNGDS